MEEDIVGDDGWHARPRRHSRQVVEPQRIVRAAAQGQRQIGAVAERFRKVAKMQRAGVIGLIGHEHRDQALAISHDIGPIEPAARLAAALFAKRKQPAEPCVSRPVGRIDEDGHTVGKIEAAAGDQAHAVVLAASWARTMPARLLRSTMASASMPSCCLGESSSQELAPRKKLKCEVHCSARHSARAAHPENPGAETKRCEPVMASSSSSLRSQRVSSCCCAAATRLETRGVLAIAGAVGSRSARPPHPRPGNSRAPHSARRPASTIRRRPARDHRRTSRAALCRAR